MLDANKIIDVVLNEEREWIFQKAKMDSTVGITDVICIDPKMHLGDISDKKFKEKRMKAFSVYDCIYDDLSDLHLDAINKIQSQLEYLKCGISDGKNVRIWYNTGRSHEVCNFYWLIATIEKWKVGLSQIEYIELPQSLLINNYTTTGFIKLVSNSARMNIHEKEFYVNCWKELVKKNSPMRILIEGVVVSVSDNFYDPYIREVIDKMSGSFKAVQIIHELKGVIENYEWIDVRLYHMEKEGYIKTISPGDRSIKRVLIKCE